MFLMYRILKYLRLLLEIEKSVLVRPKIFKA